MKPIIKFSCSLLLCLFIASSIFAQYNWELSKDKDGIKVYQSDINNSKFKCIKVECTLAGNYNKLMNILSNVSHHKDWVYNNKTAYIIKNVSPVEYYYYTETSIPWPMSNRDALVHVTINKDSLNRFLNINEVSESNYVPEKSGIIRVPRSTVSWYVTMPTSNTVSIVYIFDADPGGSAPAWLVNMFVDKAPYESFKKLSELLKQ
jgi:hypothetical protein